MTVLDLCCGTGGWAQGCVTEGWSAIGVDVVRWEHPKIPRFPGELILADIRQLDGARFRGRVDLVTASPPCTEFSRLRLPFRSGRKFAALGPPDLSIVNACFRVAREAGAPIVLENVQGAVPYLGRPRGRCGPFYLWGDGVPPMLPQVGASKNANAPHRELRIKLDNHAHTWRSVLRARVPLILARAVARWHAGRLGREATA